MFLGLGGRVSSVVTIAECGGSHYGWDDKCSHGESEAASVHPFSYVMHITLLC